MTASVTRTDRPADAAPSVAVWDLPVRLIHWSLVLLIAFSWWSAENGKIQWHLWSGTAVLFLLLFRLLWGFLGSSTARFASFVQGPAKVRTYLQRPGEWRGIGHTPLGALSVVALLGLIAFQVATGLTLSDEDGTIAGPLNRLVSFDTAELLHEVHETSFWVLLALIALHVAAIIVYRLRGKRLVGAMVSGRSTAYPAGTRGLVVASPARLALALIVAAAITGWIGSGVPGL